MGTRNLTIVHHDGKYKVAQYGQWDGYPSGQGKTILDFLKKRFARDLFLTKLAKTYEPTEDQIKAWYEEAGAKPDSEWIDTDTADRFKKAHPTLDRDLGGKILATIQSAKKRLPLKSDLNFAGDSLFCEWAYVVDLDTNKLEVYKGFNKTPLEPSDRFYNIPMNEKRNDKYYQVKLTASFDLDALPTADEFYAVCDPETVEAANA